MNWIKLKWCSWFHGGGIITRDPNDCINWQCSKCGRWADPVSKEDEEYVVNKELKEQQ